MDFEFERGGSLFICGAESIIADAPASNLSLSPICVFNSDIIQLNCTASMETGVLDASL